MPLWVPRPNPVLKNLITSAPALITSRTVARTSSGPSAIPLGRLGSGDVGWWCPDGLERFAVPWIGDSGLVASCNLGPEIKPCSTACL